MTKEKKTSFSKELKKLSKNYWAISTVIFAALTLILAIAPLVNHTTVSAEVAGQKVVDFAKAQGANAEFVSASDDGSLYEVVLSIQGQEVPVYVTKDGKTLVPQPISLEAEEEPEETTQSTPTPTNIPKSDNPEVELYVWGYCPYGVQAQGPMAEVANLLKDSATFTIVPFHDGHGAFETQQNKIQSCIQKLDSEKYWDYASGFAEKIYPKCGQSRDVECDKTEAVNLMNSLGIDSDAVMSCVEKDGNALFSSARVKAQENGVTGSPTIIINGAKANVARNAEAIKTAVCSAFNDDPEECATTLDASAAQASGNC